MHRPEWTTVRWISVNGLSDMHVMKSLATKYDLHPLAIEDIFKKPSDQKLKLMAVKKANIWPACSL